MYFDYNKANEHLLRSKMTITDLVNKSGLSQRTVYTLLNSHFAHDPKLSTLVAISKALGVKPWELVSA